MPGRVGRLPIELGAKPPLLVPCHRRTRHVQVDRQDHAAAHEEVVGEHGVDPADALADHAAAALHDDVAARLHTYYNAERFLVEDEALKLARLALVAATRQVLASGLCVLGVSAPERM